MLSIEVFPASYGDALLVTYGPRDTPTRLLIDGGLTGAATRVMKRLEELDAHIDLFVVTHIDVDHIAGAVRLLNTQAFVDRLRAVWFNGRVHLEQFNDLLGALDGERLGSRLEQLGTPWNAGWTWRHPPARPRDGFGGPVVVDGKPVRIPLPGGATAIVLSPTPAKLAKLLPEWRDTVAAAGLGASSRARREPAEPAPRVLLGGPTLRDLASSSTETDDAAANGSSIAFILEVPDGQGPRRVMRRALLTGDAHPDVLEAGLAHLRGSDTRYAVDVCKLPHHASRANVTGALVDGLTCTRWIVSTNGKRFNHPNHEALARVVLSNPDSTVYANYGDNAPITSFVNAYPPARHRYTMKQPKPGAPGVIVEIGD